MKRLYYALIACSIVAGLVSLVFISRRNRELQDEIDQLEADLGRMEITDFRRIHLVEIKNPLFLQNLLNN